MGANKHTGKARLDKYYHLAKDQGYRARSAFKLIQLAKKVDFLSKSKVCIDLCAAPGGWSQVAQKHMPAGSQIVAIDLAPIKALHGVTCIQSDITTEKCRGLIRKELKNQKADCVLHDGAPNVGSSWAKDAFGQNELTLAAMKVACEHLRPGGYFVTKVFRSADYNSLLWVFNQLFSKVEATKPTASRNVSAEIFVTCANFKAGKIDPKFFDAKWVFMEHLDPLDDGSGEKKKPGQALADFMKNKEKKHRSGYNAGDDFRIVPVNEFVDSEKPADIIVACNQLNFEAEGCEDLKNSELTTDDIKEMVKDMKVLGKRDLGVLLKWRMKILRERERIEREKKKEQDRLALALKAKTAKEMVGFKEKKAKSAKEGIADDVDDAINQFLDGADEPEEEESDDEDDEEAEAKITHELDELVQKRRKEERNEAKKTAERQKKQEWRKKLSLSNSQPQDEPELLIASNPRSLKALEEQDDYIDPLADSDDQEEVEEDSDSTSDEDLDRYAKMEVDLAIAHKLGRARDMEKHRAQLQRKAKKKKETRRERVMAQWSSEFGAFNAGLDDKAYEAHLANQKLNSDEEGDDDSDDEADLKALRAQQAKASIFDGIDGDAMESSIAGPELSVAAKQLLDDHFKEVAERGSTEDRVAVPDEDNSDEEMSTAIRPASQMTEIELREKHRANRWFSQDIFKNIGASSSTALRPLDRESDDEEEEGTMIEKDDKDLPKLPLTDKEKRKLKRKQEQEKLERLGKKPKTQDLKPMEVAPLEAPQQLDMTRPHKPTDPRELAETMALGSLLVDSKKSRMDLIDASYNRYTFDGDECLPDWFTEDENKHNKPELPITKEMMQQWRDKLREINARPIRKVAEAKARKKRRLNSRLDKLRKTAMSLVDAPDMSETAKARLMRKQLSKAMAMDQRKTTVVAIKKGGGGLRGKKEKGKTPKGAKVKVVDKRMKSDLRSEKRAAKRNMGKFKAKVKKNQRMKQRKKGFGGGGGKKSTGGKGVYGGSTA